MLACARGAVRVVGGGRCGRGNIGQVPARAAAALKDTLEKDPPLGMRVVRPLVCIVVFGEGDGTSWHPPQTLSAPLRPPPRPRARASNACGRGR
jgi:hypothetical protein